MFTDLDLTVGPGRTGLVGVNGSGKSTLLRLLAGTCSRPRTLLGLAAQLLRRPDVLLLDEPTNNLDLRARRLVYETVEAWRGVLVVVSHDRQLLELVDRVVRRPRVGTHRARRRERLGQDHAAAHRHRPGRAGGRHGCGGWCRCVYLPQRLDVLDDELSVAANVAAYAPEASDNAVRARLARFLFRGDRADQRTGTLSGGKRFRASLAALLLAEPAPQLFLLDEPTNNLDLASVRQLTQALHAYAGALVVASHDLPFLRTIGVTRWLVLDGELTESDPP